MFFQKKNPPETIIRTFNHTIGFKPEEFSADEKDIIANSAQAVLKILKNKLMVVAMYSLGNKTEHDVFKTL